jgi:hypothetical protein
MLVRGAECQGKFNERTSRSGERALVDCVWLLRLVQRAGLKLCHSFSRLCIHLACVDIALESYLDDLRSSCRDWMVFT